MRFTAQVRGQKPHALGGQENRSGTAGTDDPQAPGETSGGQLEQLRGEAIMAQVSMDLPETVYSVLHCAPDKLSRKIRLAASAHWDQMGRISQEWEAKIAGIDRTDFLLALSQMGKDSFQIDFVDLDRELARG